MTKLSRVLAVGAVLALSGGLVGCDPGGPGPSETPGAGPTASVEPSPSETEDPRDRISSIVIDGDSVYLTLSEGGVYLDLPFTTDAESAVAQLSEAIRLPETRATLPMTGCFHERTQASWGGLSFVWGPDWQRPAGSQFLATAEAASTTNGIAVAVLGGQQIGTAESAVFAGAPGAYTEDYGSWKTLHYDVAHGTATGNPDEYWGAVAIIQGGVLASFSSPVYYFYDC